MTRRGTVIRHTITTSETIAKMMTLKEGPKHFTVFLGLLCLSDDWGRFAFNPAKLVMGMPAFMVTAADIIKAVEWLKSKDSAGEDGIPCLEVYEVTVTTPGGRRPMKVCQWSKWEDHQQFLKSRDGAECPNRKGRYEKTTNPAAKARRAGRSRAVTAKSPPGDQGKGKGEVRGKGKEHEKHAEPKPSAPAIPEWAGLLELELFPKINYPHRKDDHRREGAITLYKLTTPARDRPAYSNPDEVSEVLRWVRISDHRDARFWNKQFKECGPLIKKKAGKEGLVKFLKMRDAYNDTLSGRAADTEGLKFEGR